MSTLAHLGQLATTPIRNAPDEAQRSPDRPWHQENWIKRAIEERQKLIDEARKQGLTPARGANGRLYPLLTGDQAKPILETWFGILRQSTDAARYLDKKRIDQVLNLYQGAWAAALLASKSYLPIAELELIFDAVYAIASALSEAAHYKQDIGDAPTLWSAFKYGLKNPGEIPGAVIEAEKEVASAAADYAADKIEQLLDYGKKKAREFLPIDEAKRALKWAGIIGGSALGVYVLAKILPRRSERDER